MVKLIKEIPGRVPFLITLAETIFIEVGVSHAATLQKGTETR